MPFLFGYACSCCVVGTCYYDAGDPPKLNEFFANSRELTHLNLQSFEAFSSTKKNRYILDGFHMPPNVTHLTISTDIILSGMQYQQLLLILSNNWPTSENSISSLPLQYLSVKSFRHNNALGFLSQLPRTLQACFPCPYKFMNFLPFFIQILLVDNESYAPLCQQLNFKEVVNAVPSLQRLIIVWTFFWFCFFAV